MQASNSVLKQGNILTFKLNQNVANYQIRIAHCPKGLWLCIEESGSHWKATISQQMINQTISKASSGKFNLSYKQFVDALLAGLKKLSGRWSVGVMTPIQLELLRGGTSSKTVANSKLYMIVSDLENKMHYPFTLQLSNMGEKQKLIEAIKKMKSQLEQLRSNNDKSQTSFSILNETAITSEQIKIENEQLKKRIKMYDDSLTQKRGAVEIDLILKEKNGLQLQAETRKRQQQKEIARMKGIHQMLERQVHQVKLQVDNINKQLILLQDSISNPAKLKTHALRVLKNYELELRNSKKLLTRQVKEIDNIKRNINTTKNSQRKVLTKIKQIQAQIDEVKKKANLKEISNRLSQGKGASSHNSSSKAPSIISQSDKSKENSVQNRTNQRNIVRANLLKRTSDQSNNQRQRNSLLKTSPMIHSPSTSNKKKNEFNPPSRPIISSHLVPKDKKLDPRTGSVRSQSGNSSLEKKQIKQITPAERQRQKQALQRLIAPKKTSTEIKPSQSTKNIPRKEDGRSLNNKQPINKAKMDNKDIFNRMKEIKAQYNNRAQNNQKSNALSNKVAALTANK